MIKNAADVGVIAEKARETTDDLADVIQDPATRGEHPSEWILFFSPGQSAERMQRQTN